MTTTLEPGAVDPGPHLEVRRPGDDGWDEARAAWNLAVDQRPAAVGLPRTADDVVALVAHAKATACGWPPKPPATTAAPTPPSPTRC